MITWLHVREYLVKTISKIFGTVHREKDMSVMVCVYRERFLLTIIVRDIWATRHRAL